MFCQMRSALRKYFRHLGGKFQSVYQPSEIKMKHHVPASGEAPIKGQSESSTKPQSAAPPTLATARRTNESEPLIDLFGAPIRTPDTPLRRGARKSDTVGASLGPPATSAATLDRGIGLQSADEVQYIDPRLIEPSKYSNRLSSDWSALTYKSLKESIRVLGGNAVPILVRPADMSAGAAFQVVYGHRRFRACLELGLPVLAMIREVTDSDLVGLMEMENEQRTDASPFGRGQCFSSAMKAGVFRSLGELAKAVDLDKSTVAKYVRLAELPVPIRDAFPDPARINLNWASPLMDAWKKDEPGVRKSAQEIRSRDRTPNAKDIFKALTRSLDAASSAAFDRTVYLPDESSWSVTIRIPDTRKREKIEVAVNPGALDPDALVTALADLLSHPAQKRPNAH